MADQPEETVATDTPANAATSVTPEPNPLETTTAKDGALPINVSLPTAPASTPTEPTTPVHVPDSPLVAESKPEVTPSEKPIVVSEAEVNPNVPTSSGENMANEVESLSGEIQALEAKIDRLTGNVKPVAEQPTGSPSLEVPTKEVTAPVPFNLPEPKIAEAPKGELTPAPPLPPTPDTAKNPDSKTVGINDIYSKVAEKQKEADKTPMTNDDDAQEVGSGIGVGMIGEVLLVFGVLIFMAMTAFPVYKSMLSSGISDAIRSIGWPTAVVSLAIGFLLALFSKGKAATKVFGALLLIISLVIYLGIAGYERFLGPLGPMLDSVFSFYR